MRLLRKDSSETIRLLRRLTFLVLLIPVLFFAAAAWKDRSAILTTAESDGVKIVALLREQAGNLFDSRCDDIFYFNKGRLYANYLLMRELGADFDGVIREKGLTNAWNGTVETFRIASQLDPWVVWNGYPDGFLIPNHLAAQGFYLLRARTQLREISAILLK